MRMYEAVRRGDRWYIQGLYKVCSPILVFGYSFKTKKAAVDMACNFSGFCSSISSERTQYFVSLAKARGVCCR